MSTPEFRRYNRQTQQSILESRYIEPTRPYSQKELNQLRTKNLSELGISYINVHHTKCRHFYYVKRGGRKERLIKESENSENIGNCSVCWKLIRTPNNLREYAEEVVNAYLKSTQYERQYNTKKRLTHYKVKLERVFYKWLYDEEY